VADYQFSLEPFSSEVLAAYQSFPSVLGESTEEKIAWKLNDNPFGRGVAVVVRDDRGTIVGMNAYQPVVIANSAGQRLRGHQSMDTVVAESARGQGLFTRMYQAYYDRTDADFVYGFPNKNSAHGFFTKLGWSRFGMVPMRVKPLRTGFMARRLKLGFLDFPIAAFRGNRGSSALLSSFDDRHEQAWRSVLDRSPALWGVDRSANYLNWRYRDHPTSSYELRERKDGSFVASTILDKHGARILYIMEALGEPDTLVDMLREIHTDALGRGAELALLWSAERSPLAHAFRRLGYFHFPDRLRPNEINFGARILADVTAPRNKDQWFVSMAGNTPAGHSCSAPN
jgi:GNAT superfamily N-acetyltransferase